MSDHFNYCNIADFPDEMSVQINTDDNESESQCDDIKEKSGDELLIELYRERPFLYDKSNINFKNCLMKQNAWIEISKIMTETCGDMYTPSYCQKRCISIREQYNREKKKAEIKSKSGSAAVKATRFPFFSQLGFLDNVIKRRRSYTNCSKSQPNIINEDDNTCESQSSITESSNEENNANEQHIHNTKRFNKENYAPMKKRKVNETKELEQTIVQMGQRILSYMEEKVGTADDAFMEFIKIQFKSIPEKHIKRKMIMDILTEPFPEK